MPLPTGVAPLYHWYTGAVPPLTGVAVKVTEVPAQTGLALATIVTLAVRIGFTVIVMALEVAGLPDAQAAFDVRLQVIISPVLGI